MAASTRRLRSYGFIMIAHKAWVAVAVALAVGGLAGCMASRIETSRELARQARPFSVTPESPAAYLLVVGDSTAVGTGASSPEGSLPGQLSRRAPRLAIENLARNGATFEDVDGQLRAAGRPRYDAVLILAGGNDVLGLTSEGKLRDDVMRATARAKAMAPRVVVMPSGNVGNAPFFLPPVSWIMSARSRTLHAVVREAAQAQGFEYVNLYEPREADPFVKDPGRLHSADGLHPSDEGYARWLRELLAQSSIGTLAGRG